MSRTDLVVAGTLVLPGGEVVHGEIGVRDGRIVALADPGSLDGDERIDVVRPGER